MRGSLLSSRLRPVGSSSSSSSSSAAAAAAVTGRSRTLQQRLHKWNFQGSSFSESVFTLAQEKSNNSNLFCDNVSSRSFTSTNDSRRVSNTDLQQTIDYTSLRQHGGSNEEWKEVSKGLLY